MDFISVAIPFFDSVVGPTLSPSHGGGTILFAVRGGGGSGFLLDALLLGLLLSMIGGLSTSTQSSSPPSFHGFPSRFLLSIMPSLGGRSVLRAPLFPSNHHFLLSLLAGGSPSCMLW